MSEEWVVLDTHIWVWVINGEVERLSQDGLTAIEEASQQGLIAISAISVWEVGMLEAKGRLKFNQLCMDWVRAALTAPGVRLVPLSPEIAILSSRLPGNIHGDPADRILAATCRLLGGKLVTKDRELITYGKQAFLSVIEG